MKRFTITMLTMMLLAAGVSDVSARGFGARGGAAAGGYRGGAAAGGYRAGAATGPGGGFHAGGAQAGSWTGPRGTTVDAGRAGGVATGPFGGVHAGGARGAEVTTPGGRTFAGGSAGRVGVGPGGAVHAGGVHAGAVTGPFGGVAEGRFGGVTVGPGGVRIGGAAAVAGHATRYTSPAAYRTQAAYVRGGYYHGAFAGGWYRGYPNAWWPGRWRFPNYWFPPLWPNLSLYCGIAAPPIVYDYGSNVVIQDNSVYIDGNQVASADQYAQQATQIADAGRAAQPAKDGEWQGLGVFGLVQGDEKTAQNLFQIAINQNGVVRGNYYDAVSDTTLPIFGSLDKKSQRLAWSIGDRKTIVYETGLQNLTQNETSVLVHHGAERTQQMLLVRLEEPKNGKN